MYLKQGASLHTPDGQSVGHIDRVVISPQTKEVTHIVIRKGVLLTQDKVVPIELVSTEQPDTITLHMTADELDHLPEFKETQYVELTEDELVHGRVNPPALYPYPLYGDIMSEPFYIPGYTIETIVNIPDGTVALKEGARVTASDGKHVGEVSQVLTSPGHGRVTHISISKGIVQRETRLIPVAWIDHFDGDGVYLSVGSRMIEGLSHHEPA